MASIGSVIAHSKENEHELIVASFCKYGCCHGRTTCTLYTSMEPFPRKKEKGISADYQSSEHETRAEPAVEGTIPIHAYFLFGANIFAPDKIFV